MVCRSVFAPVSRAAMCLLVGCFCLLGQAGHAAAPEAGAGFAAEAISGCKTDLRYLNQISGWQARWPREWARFGTLDAQGKARALERWRGAPEALAQDTAGLRKGMGTRRAAPGPVVRRVLQQVDDLYRELESAVPGLTDGQPASEAEKKWVALFEESLRPAVAAYRDFLRDEYLPHANPKDGLAGIEDGARCFLEAVHYWTTLDATRSDLVEGGNALLAEMRAQMVEIAGASEDELPALLERLRRSALDGQVTRSDILEISRAAVARAMAAAPNWFYADRLAPVDVLPMESHLEASFPAGYYRPAEDGARAAYIINLSRPSERRLMAEVIAFHEAVPGHHIGRVMQQGEGFYAGFGEGWAIYAEFLADEMGLYGSRLDRMGMAAKHLWAASRLPIEAGLHLEGWTREQAVAFMKTNTAMPEAEIALEVDRYLAMPGQSLSYMLGYMAFRDARKAAEAALGDRFDIKAFHKVVLEPGMRPLAKMQADVSEWVASHTNPPSN